MIRDVDNIFNQRSKESTEISIVARARRRKYRRSQKKNYNDIQKITPECFVQVLTELEGTFLKLNFFGDKSPQSFCYVKINAPAITYFKEKNHNRLAFIAFTTKEVVIAITSAAIGAAVGSLIAYLLTTKL